MLKYKKLTKNVAKNLKFYFTLDYLSGLYYSFNLKFYDFQNLYHKFELSNSKKFSTDNELCKNTIVLF